MKYLPTYLLTYLPIGVCVYIMLILSSPLALAAVVHVRQDGTGDCRTITACLTRLQSGDTLRIHGGTYADVLYSKTVEKGTPTAVGIPDGVTLQAAPGETVILTPDRDGEGRSEAVVTIEGQNITLDGLIIDPNWRFGGALAAWGRNNTYKNLEMRHAFGQAVTGPARQSQFLNVEVHHNGQYCRAGDSYCPSHGYHHGMYLGGEHDVGSSLGILIDGCYIHDQGDGLGLQLYAGGVTMRNSVIANNSGHGVFALGNGNTFYNNLFVNNGKGPYDSGANPEDAYGAHIFVTGSNNRIFHNTFYTPNPNKYNAGLYLRTPADVRNNLFLNVAMTAARYLFQAATGSTFRNNLCTVPTAGCALVEPRVASVVLDAAAGDLHVAAGSPAMGAAPFLALVPTDKDGKPRGAQTDVGAYVFGSTPVNIVPAPTEFRATVRP